MSYSVGESVGTGHPDKICDQVADLVLDAALAIDRHARVACEVMLFDHQLMISGEISWRRHKHDQLQNVIVAKVKRLLLRTMAPATAERVRIQFLCQPQSHELRRVKYANDQCVVTGYASDETDVMLPLAQVLAHELLQKIHAARQRPPFNVVLADMKSLITINTDHDPVTVWGAVSVQHQLLSIAEFRTLKFNLLEQIIAPLLTARHLPFDPQHWVINGAGPWVHGGADADTGVTGRKIVVDCYGANVVHGGGAFSGKDITKMDRAGAYFCRYIAKNIVRAKLARRCMVQMAFHIDGTEPSWLRIDTFGTAGQFDNAQLEAAVCQLARLPQTTFSLKVTDVLRQMALSATHRYQDLAVYGHFGRPDLPNIPWEQVNRQFGQQLRTILTKHKELI